MKQERKEEIVQAIFNCDGVIVDGNWIVYPSENEDGYDDHDNSVVEFYANSEDQDPIAEFSMNDLDNAKTNLGVLIVNSTEFQLLTKLNVI